MESINRLTSQLLSKTSVAILLAVALNNAAAEDLLSKAKCQEDLKQCAEIFKKRHQNLYVYTTEAEYDKFIDSQIEKIDRDLSLVEFYNLIDETVAFVKCYHSSAEFPKAWWKKKVFPLKTHYDGERLYIVDGALGDSDIALGSEILAINDQPISQILDALRKQMPVDGGIEEAIVARIDRYFPYQIGVRLSFPDTYTIRSKAPDGSENKVARFNALASDKYESSLRKPSKQYKRLDLEIFPEQNTALLVIKSFSFYKDKFPKFASFLEKNFAKINESSIQNLIIDIRGNGGGDPHAAWKLMQYLIEKPTVYFGDVPGYSFLKRPVHPIDGRFEGNVTLLVDGMIGSTSGHFAGLVKYHKLAKFVGSDTGATYFCSGNPKSFTLDNSKIAIRVGQRAYYTAVEGMEKGKPIKPDHFFKPSLEDIIEGKDSTLEFALSLATVQ